MKKPTKKKQVRATAKPSYQRIAQPTSRKIADAREHPALPAKCLCPPGCVGLPCCT